MAACREPLPGMPSRETSQDVGSRHGVAAAYGHLGSGLSSFETLDVP